MAVKKTTRGRASQAPQTIGKKRVSKKTTGKKKGPSRKKATPKGKPSLIHELKKIGLGIAILLAICLTTAMLADIFLKSGRPVPHSVRKEIVSQETKTPSRDLTALKTGSSKVAKDPEPLTKSAVSGLMKKTDPPSIVYEVFEDVDPEHTRKKPVSPAAGDKIPKIAIIIDDIGYDKRLAMALFDLNKDITFSVLPFSPFGKILAGRLSTKGAELMLHLPMEPTQYPRVNPGPGALLASMTPDALLTQLRKDLDAVPGVVGVNNHMGSRLTSISPKMNQIFTVLKKEGLFFIDSRTAPNSKGEAAARLFRLRFSHRDIFLDNNQNIEYISGQFRKLIKRAEKHGHAIGIGHPYQATLDTLKIELPKVKGRIRVVPASYLVNIPG